MFNLLFSKNNKKLDDVIYWQNATYAVLTHINSENNKLVGGLKKSKKEAYRMRDRLEYSWSITSSEDLIDTIENLKENGHNKNFVENTLEFEIPKYIYKEDFIRENLQYVKKGYEDLVLNIYDIWQKDRKNKYEPIIAWDLCRAIYLCHAGYIADYLNYEDALDRALELSLILQPKFNNWDDFFESYLDGFQYWQNEFISEKNSQAAKRLKIFEMLKSKKDSPYNLDWNMELKKTW